MNASEFLRQNEPVSESFPRYANSTLALFNFSAANTASQAVSLTGTTTYTGLAMANPSGSGVAAMLIDVVAAPITSPATAGVLALGVGAAVALTQGTANGTLGQTNSIGSGAVSKCNIGASCTLGANAAVFRAIAGYPGTSDTGVFQVKDETAGVLILQPGQMVYIVAVGTAISIIGTLTWLEMPLA